MPRTFCNHIAAAIARIEALFGWLLTTSYDFDTASTGIQGSESLRTKATNGKKATYASALTEAVYVLYRLLEMKMPQKAHHSADDRCQPQAWIKSSPPQGVEHLGFELGPTQLAA